jgi:hypothetical protein
MRAQARRLLLLQVAPFRQATRCSEMHRGLMYSRSELAPPAIMVQAGAVVEARQAIAWVWRPHDRRICMQTDSFMITLEDCVALCGLTEQEVLAIAEHEHLPEIAAAAFASYLVHQEHHGLDRVRDMITDDIRTAQARCRKEHVLVLLHVLHHFLRAHPEARPKQHPWSRCF